MIIVSRVFGTAWDRTGKTGACDHAEGCYIGWWKTSDLENWENGTAITFDDNIQVFNTDVSFVPSEAIQNQGDFDLPNHQAIMAIEMKVLDGSTDLKYFALNTGSDGDLTKNWVVLNNSYSGGGHACPAVRYNKDDSYYYLSSGGEEIDLRRSQDLMNWEELENPIAEPSKTGSGGGDSLDAKVF